MVVLNTLFSWLVQAGYLAGNPLALARQRTRRAAPRITRYLEPGLGQAVKDTIASMPQDTARARAHAHRVRWLFTLLYLGGLRIAEAGGHKLGQRDGPVLRAARHRRHDALVADRARQGGQGPAGAGDA
jgi:integrase